jgi:transcriptional regulator with XRE-family HTH domain
LGIEEIDFTEQEIADFYHRIMENIRELRKSKGFSQMDLAYAIGHKSMSSIAKIESGHENKHYNLEHLYKISKVLGVDICELLKSH